MFARLFNRGIWLSMGLAMAVTLPVQARAAELAIAGPLPLPLPLPFPVKCITRLGQWTRTADLSHHFGTPVAGARVYGGLTLGGDVAGTQVHADASAGVDGEFLGTTYDLIEATAHGDANRSVASGQADLYVLGNLVRHYQASGPSSTTLPIAASWGKVVTASQEVQVGPISVRGEAGLSVYGGINGTAQLGIPFIKLALTPYVHGDVRGTGGVAFGPVGSITGFGNARLVDAQVPFTAEADAAGALACGGQVAWKLDGIAHLSGGGGSLGVRIQLPTIWPFPPPDPIEATLVTLPAFSGDIPFSGSGGGSI
jgi:hypothetical protein